MHVYVPQTPVKKNEPSRVWTDEMEEELVEMCRAEDYLYGMRKSQYRNWKKKSLTLQRFAAHFNVTGTYRRIN